MSAKTGIEWTDATWNPWMGCSKVSPGCAHCYMFMEQRRYGKDPAVIRRSTTTFDDPLRWAEPLRVFTCSWSDWFHPEADAWRPEAWDIVRRTPHLTYQILTKRPELIADRLPPDWGAGYPNVWLGTSIENRRFVDRADLLREIPAAVRFISAEPLLGPLEGLDLFDIDWLIAGGESGSKRDCDPDWVRQLRDHCVFEGVAFFFKQWGAVRAPGRGKGGHQDAMLDGRRWTEMPASALAVANA